MTFTMVVPLAGERMVPVLGRQWFFGLKMVNDGFEFIDIVAALFGKPEVFEKTAGGFDEKQGLGARAASDGTKVLEGRQFLGMLRFFKGVQRVSVWDRERKGDALMEFNLGVEQAYRFGFGKAEAVEDFHGPLFQAGVDTSVNAVGHGICTAFLTLQLYVICRAKRRCFMGLPRAERTEWPRNAVPVSPDGCRKTTGPSSAIPRATHVGPETRRAAWPG